MRIDQVNRLRRQGESLQYRDQRAVADLLAHHVGQGYRDAMPHRGGLYRRGRVVDFERRLHRHAPGFLPVPEAPFAVRHQAREGDHRVVPQVRRRCGDPAPCKIIRARDQDPMDRADPLGDQGRVRQVSDPHRDVDPFLDEVHDTIEQENGRRHPRVLSEEAADDRRQGGSAEGHRRRDVEVAPRQGGFAHRLLLGSVEIGEDTPCAFEEALADVGDGQAARGAVEDARAEPLFQRGDGARHRRRRQAQPRSGLDEAARVGHRDEHLELMQPVQLLFLLEE